VLRRKPPWRYYFIFLFVLIVGASIFAYPKIRFERKLESARKELAARHLLNAQDKIDDGLRRWPDDLQFHFLAGRCARLRGDFNEAEKHLKRCQDDEELKADVMLEQALIQAARGDLAGVESKLQGLVREQNPEWSWILEAIAEGHRKQLYVVESLNCADQWLREQPNFPPALRLKAECVNLRAGALEAVPIYQRALELDPEFEEARYQLAQLQLDGPAKDMPAALRHFEILYRHRLGHLDYQLGYAVALVETGRMQEAQPLVDEILADQPKLALALLLRGRIALALGHAREAMPFLRQALERDPARFQTHFALAECLRQQGQETEAEQMMQRGAEARKDSQRLFEITARLIPESPRNAELYFEAGEIQLRYQHDTEALSWFGRALREDPQHRATHKALADYFEKAGNLPLAKYHREFLKKK
jgi:tetratricopeptide (TPR) repeat protein